MYFIVFDLEFNQDILSLQNFNADDSRYPFEIIQIGAIKLDQQFNTIGNFNRYIKPTFYQRISPFITDLTGITTEQLLIEEQFPEVYKAFTEFIGDKDSVFCIWGMSDIKGLLSNINYHNLNPKLIPEMIIDLQPYVAKHLKQSLKNLLGLQRAVELLNIPITFSFHNALHDAHYTAEVLKIIYNPSIQPKHYDQPPIGNKARYIKSEIDTDRLVQQFEKMYARSITEEEQEMIKLAYKMGRTNQFLK